MIAVVAITATSAMIGVIAIIDIIPKPYPKPYPEQYSDPQIPRQNRCTEWKSEGVWGVGLLIRPHRSETCSSYAAAARSGAAAI